MLKVGNGASLVQNGSPVLVVPNTTRGGSDPVKCWYEQAREEQAKLFSTINLQCFQTNVKNTASKWYKGAHNPMNSSNPPRTTTDQHDTMTQDQEDDQYDDDDLPALPGDIPQAANEDNVSFVCKTILLQDGEGNEMPFNYVQSKYTKSLMTSSGTWYLLVKEKMPHHHSRSLWLEAFQPEQCKLLHH